MAGLSAARHFLINNMYDFKIIEAQEYIGGRIKSAQMEDSYIEVGAQWIHGSVNELALIAQVHDLLSEIPSSEGKGLFFRSDGSRIEEKVISEITDVVEKILKECETFNTTEDPAAINFSVGEYLINEYNAHMKINVNRESWETWTEMLKWHKKFLSVDNGCIDVDNLSARSWGDYDFDGGDSQSYISFKNGYSSITDFLMRSFPPDSIDISTPVVNVKWDPESSTVHVYGKEGEVYETEHVIVTIPLGVLKVEHEKLFTPNLPLLYQQAIDSMGYASIGKVILQFQTPWWSAFGRCDGLQFVWKDEEDEQEIKKKTEVPRWLKYVTGFDVITVGPPNTLIGWVAHDGVEEMEALPEEQVAKDCVEALQMFTGIQPSPITHIHKSNWESNPYIRGAYSHLTTDCDFFNVNQDTLAVPICSNRGQPLLLMAGEACHSKFWSTTHGAYYSGKKQASVIIQHINEN